MVSGIIDALGLAVARGRRAVERRRVDEAGLRVVDAAARRVADAAVRRAFEARAVVLRLAVLAAFRVLVAARRVVLAARRVVLAARRRVAVARDREPAAIWRACFVSPSMRFKTVLTSARVVALLACACSCLIAARAVLSASLILRSTWRRRSGGTLFSASRSA
jgi:hypothetical protein